GPRLTQMGGLCQCVDTMKRSTDLSAGSGRPRKLVALAVVLGIVCFGALGQGGPLPPVLRLPYGGGSNTYSFASIENDSWASGTVTGVEFPNGRSTVTIAGVGTIRVMLYKTDLSAKNGA